MERVKRMPEVEKMTKRYQDSWTEIHEHTARNSDKADDADEILGKVLELCTRHVKASVQLAEEAKDLKDLDKSMDEMVSMSADKIQTLEEKDEVMSLADWKKSQTTELDKYMEAKRKELWDKAEILSTRSEQFQKEEAARKLRLYQNKFETDMERFRRNQEEKEQELWKKAEEIEAVSEVKAWLVAPRPPPQPSTISPEVFSIPSGPKRLQRENETSLETVFASEILQEEVDLLREKEDLDRFLGPAIESDSKEAGIDFENSDRIEDESDDGMPLSEEEDDDDDVGEEEEEEEEEEDDDEDTTTDDEMMDPIAKARKARIDAAAAQHSGSKIVASGSTISAFSALGKHASASTASLSK
ncbi:hypothetical protein BGX28_002063 [Mortierella sp. GBA30]|nr:hypothetical protein BGX28_002063 [Mortierella sp. GBA30]